MRWIALLLVAWLMIVTACTTAPVDPPLPVEHIRQATWEQEPACFLQFNECDESGEVCQLVRREYVDADGIRHSWEDCNTQYTAWLERLRVAKALLRRKDPYPQCYKADRKVLSAMGQDPKDPDALLYLAEEGNMIGSPACTLEWCAWMTRNIEPGLPLPSTCQVFESRRSGEHGK